MPTTDNFDEVLGQESTVRINLLTQASSTKWEVIARMTTEPTFDVERAKEALRKRQIIQNKYANKHAIVLPVLHQNAKVWFKHKMKEPWKQGTIIHVGPQPHLYIVKGEDGGVFRRNKFPVRRDYTENDNPRWSRTVEYLYNSDATEISRIPNLSADSQINASP
ncbi:integrase catalytic domain-containing protein [Trichonephila clavata]|uniref:Integrase catalytic domain-containing protein n=1 Tax=Trichonephila clavata TaxID=2740835 RepID=A0A8X6G0D6_TRICU|nr:integrase catalytic domain-containing protein [Trichonephila clavata]